MTNSSTGGQITGIEFDNDTTTSSSNITVSKNRIERLTVGPEFLERFGYQTDGINTVRPGTGPLIIAYNDISDVGEGIDHFGHDSKITRNNLGTCFNFGIKLIHGATANLVSLNQITDAGLGGIVVVGSTNSLAGDTADNVIVYNTIAGVGAPEKWQSNSTFGISVQKGYGVTKLPMRTVVRENDIDLGYEGKFGILIPDGSGTGHRIISNRIVNYANRDYKMDMSTVARFVP